MLSITGLILIVVGLASTLIMLIAGIWLTYIFPLFLAVGIIFCILDIPIRKSLRISETQKLIIQLCVIIIPIIFIVKQTINTRTEIIIVPKEFTGPYIVIYGIKGQPKLPNIGKDIIVRIPLNRIILTSTKQEQTSKNFETYVEDSVHKYGIQTKYLSTYNGTMYNLKTQNQKFYYRTGFYHNRIDTFYYDTLDKWANNVLDSIFAKY